jgi:hypothetical protein
MNEITNKKRKNEDIEAQINPSNLIIDECNRAMEAFQAFKDDGEIVSYQMKRNLERVIGKEAMLQINQNLNMLATKDQEYNTQMNHQIEVSLSFYIFLSNLYMLIIYLGLEEFLPSNRVHKTGSRGVRVFREL